jgi:hypothetical protein
MKSHKSDCFSHLALNAFNRVGDILIPPGDGFPSFSEYGAAEHLDRAAAFAPQDDIKQLNLLMSVLAFAPRFFLRFLVKQAVASHQSKAPWAPALRKLYYGWWGLIFGAYYSGRPGKEFQGADPTELIQFRLNRVLD